MEVVQVELGEDSTPPTVEILTEPDNGVAGDQLWGFLVKPSPIKMFYLSGILEAETSYVFPFCWFGERHDDD